ncbi:MULTISPECIES: class I SAM-dependent DNA methyltransferase [unclassified Saccharibacter]|uniref:type I restriction-modification system subunit M n=1 Tax=unclassified Saccharibacter TaxID=2648722 RepID=UPI00132579CB|nr:MULTISPECIES: class I SAM-dependent DNA methyltransferase [unclassified Saccharibacter]MXV35469.1 N-6 DNA methylase [Saccharibacter sp. EH611]MXV58129.1 N-6 DNA methylase [Saccharibacter sp. EH70]MXV65403.1 N-6 DNA methylase [Saccharibacter sp. EH60]
MLTGQIRNQIDQVWNTFWSGGVSNPLSVIEQMTFLIFIKRLDDVQLGREAKANALSQPIESPIFPTGNDPKGEPYDHLRWSRFKNFEAREMMRIVDQHVFPFLRSLGDKNSSYGLHMKDARLGFSNANLLAKVVALLDELDMGGRDTKGDIYEYMLSKIASAGTNGQFRTPRHIIELMVALTRPTPTDVICDPAAGTCGFLVGAGEYLRQHAPQLLRNAEQRDHFLHHMFHGFDFDATMLRIGAMNMALHGVEDANITYRDSLAESHSEDAGTYSLILANPPFAGSLDYDTTAKDLLQLIKTKKTELLFLALFLRLLKVGGRAAVVVPEGVLFGASTAHKKIRKILIEKHKLDAIIKLPSGVFRPYAGVSCAIILFTKTGVGGTKDVWFYDMHADGFSLDDKRSPLLDETQLGTSPEQPLDEDGHRKNNLPDILTRWDNLKEETKRPRTAQSFTVSKEEIATNDYDLSLNRYKETIQEEIHYPSPVELLEELHTLDAEISAGMTKLEEMLG